MILRASMVLLVTALLGCASEAPEQEGEALLLQAILPPQSAERSLSLSQLVVGKFQDQEQTLRVEIDLTPQRLVMVALTSMGVPVFTLEQHASSLDVQALGQDAMPFDPRHILSDFQIAFWPAAVLTARFETLGLSLRETPDKKARTIFGQQGQTLVEIAYDDPTSNTGDIAIVHFDRPYRLRIKTLHASGAS